MNMAYNINIPIKVLFDQIEDGMDYTVARNNPKIPKQIMMTGQQPIIETDFFTAEINNWERLPVAD